MSYEIGDVATVRGVFTIDGTQTNFDPTTVKVFIRTPRRVETVYVFGIDPRVVKEATGRYSFDLPLTLPSRGCAAAYYYRWVGYDVDGNPQAGDEKMIEVEKTHFTTPV